MLVDYETRVGLEVYVNVMEIKKHIILLLLFYSSISPLFCSLSTLYLSFCFALIFVFVYYDPTSFRFYLLFNLIQTSCSLSILNQNKLHVIEHLTSHKQNFLFDVTLIHNSNSMFLLLFNSTLVSHSSKTIFRFSFRFCLSLFNNKITYYVNHKTPFFNISTK